MSIRIGDYPQLSLITWHIPNKDFSLTEAEALSTYERHWRHVDQAALTEEEQALIEHLIATVGNGLFLADR